MHIYICIYTHITYIYIYIYIYMYIYAYRRARAFVLRRVSGTDDRRSRRRSRRGQQRTWSRRRCRLLRWPSEVSGLHAQQAPCAIGTPAEAWALPWSKPRWPLLGRGEDTVGHPHRAQIVQFELFELFDRIEIRQTILYRTIRANSISINSIPPPSHLRKSVA